ncbi:hypothetical protein [Kluyvera intermedia]
MAYVIADVIKGLEELLERRLGKGKLVQAEKNPAPASIEYKH